MASVSPWFFTVCPIYLRCVILTDLPQHYGPDSFNKNWIYRGDDWLYAERWELLVQHRSQVDLVEIVTWNGKYHLIFPSTLI
jgi:glucan endo-1,3-alpha-glucosidase